MEPESMILVDIDGTLANSSPYLYLYEQGKNKEWEASFKEHEVFEDIKGLVNRLYEEGHYVVLMTARSGKFKTQLWLKENGIKYHVLHTNVLFKGRPWKDIGKAKKEIYLREYQAWYNLFLVIDDSPYVINEFKGIASTFHVNPQGLK